MNSKNKSKRTGGRSSSGPCTVVDLRKEPGKQFHHKLQLYPRSPPTPSLLCVSSFIRYCSFFLSPRRGSFFLFSPSYRCKFSAMSYPTLPNLPPATPQKAVPGAYLQTPAVARHDSVFRSPMRPTSPQPPMTPMPKLPPTTTTKTLSAEERGAHTISQTLALEAQYPDLDSYLSRQSIALPITHGRVLTPRRRSFVPI